MTKKNEQPIDYDHPVAYDINGRPLYARPVEYVETDKEVPPEVSKEESAEVTDEERSKHEKSKKIYPGINLCEGEYVIKSLKRHPIGLVAPFVIGILIITIAFSVLFNYEAILYMFGLESKDVNLSIVALPVFLIIILVITGTYISYYVYVNNKFFLTNESIFQTIQISLFSKREQVISLDSIEDASYTQMGILQHLFNYGSIRLSTIGDENTYRLSYVTNPKEQIDMLNNAVDSYKKGKAV